MRVLIYAGYNSAPHLETEMEIAYDLLKQGAEVFFVLCEGQLSTCFDNPMHRADICRSCISKKKSALRFLKIKKENIISLPRIEVKEDLFPDTFNTLDELKEFSFESVDIGLGVASSIISRFRDHKINTLLYKNEIKVAMKTALYSYLASKIVLEKVNPDEVFLFNGRFLEQRPVMRLCELKGITYYTHERGGVLTRYLLRKNDIPHSIEATRKEVDLMWGDGGIEKEKVGKKFFEDRRNKVVQGWYVYTKNQAKGTLPHGYDENKTNIVLFNSSMDEYEGVKGFSNKIYRDDNDGISKIVRDLAAYENIHIYLRCHPNLKGLNNSQVKEINQIVRESSNLTIIPPEEAVDSYSLVDAADIVVIFNSTIGAEAAFWNKPVVLLGNAFYGFLEGFYKPKSHEEVLALLTQKLIPLDNKEVLKYGYWELNRGIPFKYYKPDSVNQGRFLGKIIDQSFYSRLVNKLTRLANS